MERDGSWCGNDAIPSQILAPLWGAVLTSACREAFEGSAKLANDGVRTLDRLATAQREGRR